MTTTNYVRLMKQSKVQRPDYRTDMFGNKQIVPSHIIDAVAEQKLTQGYNVRRSNLCRECFTYRSVNGQCQCS